VAVIWFAAMGNPLVVNTAEFPLTAKPPRAVDPFWKVIVPVATPPNSDLIVAVKVTLWPKMAGFGIEASATVLVAWFTICVRTEELLGEKFASPL